MIMLWKAVVFEVGVQGLQAHPQKFWFAENLGKSPKNPGRNGVQRRLTAPKVCMKKHEDLFLEVTPKRGLHDLCGRKFVGINCTKTFRASLGKFGQNPLHPKNLPAPTPMMKRHICPRCPLLKGQGNDSVPGVPASWWLLSFSNHILYPPVAHKINYEQI